MYRIRGSNLNDYLAQLCFRNFFRIFVRLRVLKNVEYSNSNIIEESGLSVYSNFDAFAKRDF